MTAVELALRTALLDFVWQGVVVAFVLWMALLLMRKRSANARYLASCLALAALVALPLITACVVYTAPAAAIPSELMPESAAPSGAWLWTSSNPSRVSWLALFQQWAVPLWFLGVALFSIRLAWGSRQVAALRRSGEAADGSVRALADSLAARLGLTRPVRLLISSLTDGPSVVGWIRPVVLLPAATLAGLTPEQLEAVLAHELAHIRRYDYLVNILQMVVETLLFYHPAVWWISGRMRHERELCCDDLAVSLCGDALCYARALTRLERMRTLAPKMAMGGTDGPLFYRIQRLTGAATRRFGPSRLPGILAMLLGVMCIAAGLNWARLHAQDVRSQQPPKPAPVAGQATPDPKSELGPASVKDRADDSDDDDDVDVEMDSDTDRDADCDSDVDTDVDVDRDSDADDEAIVPENLMVEVEDQLKEAESALEESESELGDKFADLSLRVAEARSELEKLGKLDEHINLTADSVLKRIRILGISDQSRADLLKRLPVKEGDKLSKTVMENVDKALREFDSHLYFITVPTEGGDAAIVIRRK